MFLAPRPDPNEDDLVEMPGIGSLDGEEELGVEGDLDDPIAGLDEPAGLDAETGEDSPIDIAEFGIGGGEDERWLDAGEEAGDFIEMDAVDAPGAEDGQREGSEAAEDDEAWDDVLPVLDEAASFLGDAGEEGVEEETHEGGDDDATQLPALHGNQRGNELLADDLDLGEDLHVSGEGLSFEEEARLSGAMLPRSHPRLEVSHLGPDDDAIAALSLSHGALLAGGETLYVLDRDRLKALDLPELNDKTVTSIVRDAAGRLVVGTRLGGVLVGDERTLRPVSRFGKEAGGDGFFVVAEAREEGVRVWGRTRGGGLFRSENFGETWIGPLLPSAVAAIGADASGTGFAALLAPKTGRAQLAYTIDGGQGFRVHDVVASGEDSAAIESTEGVHSVALRGHTFVVTRDRDEHGPLVSRDEGAIFERLLELPHAGACAITREGDGDVLYVSLFFDSADRGVVVRRVLGSKEPASLVLDVREEREARRIEARGDVEGDNRVLALAAIVAPDETVLYVGTGAGLFRVRVDTRAKRVAPA